LFGVEAAFYGLATQLGFIGTFLVSFIGASSILIPIPYQAIVFWVGVNTDINPYILILSAGLGSAVGELVGYFIGYAAKHVISERRKRRFDAMLRILMRHKNIWPLLIFIFALTPLPDDLLFIPLGIIHFSFLRAFLPCLVGKVAMFYVLIFGGRYASDILSPMLGGEGSYITTLIFTVATVAILIVTIFGMLKVDWEKILVKYEGLMRAF